MACFCRGGASATPLPEKKPEEPEVDTESETDDDLRSVSQDGASALRPEEEEEEDAPLLRARAAVIAAREAQTAQARSVRPPTSERVACAAEWSAARGGGWERVTSQRALW